MEVVGGHEITPLAENLLVFGNYQEREGQFSLMMWPLIGGLHTRAFPLPRQLNNTESTFCFVLFCYVFFLKKTQIWVDKEVWVDLGGVRGVDVFKMHFI